MSFISIKNIKKQFEKKEILKLINLDIKENEFVALLGPSGCGKSTLLRIIAGLERENEGDIYVNSKRMNDLSPRERHLSMVFQNYAVFPHMTVAENIGFGLMTQKVSQAVIDKKVKDMAELMHIEQYLNRYSGQLSGGQRQRVAVARALATEPKVLLMDEPLSNLDALLRLEMRSELKTILNQSKTTTIYVTHDQVEAMSMADRIAVMYEGEVQQYDTPDNIYHSPATEFVGGFMGNPPMNFILLDNIDFLEAPSEASKAGIRPENLFVDKQNSSNAWKGVIRVIESLGSHLQLMIDIKGQTIRVNTANDQPLLLGDEVFIRPQLEKLHWYDQTGSLI